MNLKERIEEQLQLLEVMKAAEKGASVQRGWSHEDEWFDDPDPDFNRNFKWRVRPKPKTFKVEMGRAVKVNDVEVFFTQIEALRYKLFEKDVYNRFIDKIFNYKEEIPYDEEYNGLIFTSVEN